MALYKVLEEVARLWGREGRKLVVPLRVSGRVAELQELQVENPGIAGGRGGAKARVKAGAGEQAAEAGR